MCLLLKPPQDSPDPSRRNLSSRSGAPAASPGALPVRSCGSAATSSGCSRIPRRCRDPTLRSGCPGMSHGRHTSSGASAVGPGWPSAAPHPSDPGFGWRGRPLLASRPASTSTFPCFPCPASLSIARTSHTALRRAHGHHSPNGAIKHYLPVYSSRLQRQNYHEKECTKVRGCT